MKKGYSKSIAKEIAKMQWYHSINLGEYGYTKGVYKHDIYLQYYGFPPDLMGKSVLDVGAGDGYFSFLFEDLGAKVTAINPPSYLMEDFIPSRKKMWDKENKRKEERLELAKKILRSKVVQKRQIIYDISPKSTGQFDIVFCGSVLCHLINPLGALIKLFDVTKDKLIISTPILDPSKFEDKRYCYYIGEHHTHTFFIPSLSCLESWIRSAGFKDVRTISVFDLQDHQGRPAGGIHATMHATK